jgi:hypothetical protein
VLALSRAEWPFALALAAGLVVRVLVQVAFPPAFVFSDGPVYLAMVDDLRPSPDRPVGYGAFLWLLSQLDRGVDLVAVVQHLIGLATAVVAYALLRRRGVSSAVATLAVLPVLLDGMVLSLEHSVLSDALFLLLLVLAVAALGWRSVPRPWQTAAAGLLLGLATLVRLVSGPTVVVAALFVVLVASTPRARVVQVGVLLAAFLLPVVAYAGWYHHDRGAWTLTQSGGRTLYMRTTSFVDCADLSIPPYERTLCPVEPVGDRRDPTYYGFHDSRTIPRLDPPAGTSQDAAMRDFARRAILQQPVAYARVVGRDFAMPFVSMSRDDQYGYETAWKWQLQSWTEPQQTSWAAPAYAAHGGEQPHVRRPLAGWLAGYGRHVHLPGPVLALLVVVSVAGIIVRRRGMSELRALALLLLAMPLVLVLVPDVTAQFTWRYQLPLLGLLPLSAAASWTRLRRQRGTTATPSTDWPNGGTTLRSRARVTGTTNRS